MGQGYRAQLSETKNLTLVSLNRVRIMFKNLNMHPYMYKSIKCINTSIKTHKRNVTNVSETSKCHLLCTPHHIGDPSCLAGPETSDKCNRGGPDATALHFWSPGRVGHGTPRRAAQHLNILPVSQSCDTGNTMVSYRIRPRLGA